MTYGVSNGHVIDDITCDVTPKVLMRQYASQSAIFATAWIVMACQP